jgi:hypothetical protein
MRTLLIINLILLVLLAACEKVDISKLSTVKSDHETAGGKRIYFNNAGNWVDENFSYNAGDTFVLSAGITYTYFSMANVHDVTFINEGGTVQMQNGFNFNGCTNIHVNGTGSQDFYGFEISSHTAGDVGIDINGRSSHITVNNVFVHDKTYGFWVKQEVEATCDESLYYPNWYMDSISIFNCMIKRVNQEGMYLGSTGENADRLNGCGQHPYPMRLSNVSVHDNIVDSTGRGGIMLSGADKGTNSIYNNTITRCGYELNSYQGNGIVIGGNAYANIDHNTIKKTLCDGIWVLGAGVTRVRNNVIDSSGWLDGTFAGFMHGIAFDARPTYPFQLSTFRIRGNSIGKHTDVADIYIYNTYQNDNGKLVSGFSATNNLIYNNNKGLAKVATQTGIIYKTQP